MILTEKRKVRRDVRAKIAMLSSEDKREQSALIFSKIASSEQFSKASVVALYVSLADEPQTADFIAALSQSKRVVVPRIEGDEMDFYDIAEGLQRGAFDIMEPIADKPIEPSQIDLMILPGVAFTRQGARLGRGKGFYDKYLSRKGFRAKTIGVCYACQVVESLPTEEHDRTLDEVVSSE